MDDIRVMIQDELRQALTRLMPPTPTTVIPIAAIIPFVADAPLTTTVPTTIAIPHAVIVLPIAILTNDIKGKPSNNIKVMPTVQMKKKNIRSAGGNNCQTGGTYQENTSRVANVHKVQQTRRFSNFNQPLSKVLERLVQKSLL